jgi:hypothetical protein
MSGGSDTRPNSHNGTVSLRHFVKRCGERATVDEVSLDVRAGECRGADRGGDRARDGLWARESSLHARQCPLRTERHPR